MNRGDRLLYLYLHASSCNYSACDYTSILVTQGVTFPLGPSLLRIVRLPLATGPRPVTPFWFQLYSDLGIRYRYWLVVLPARRSDRS